MTYITLSVYFSCWNVGMYAIRRALRRAGYKQYIARSKPLLSAKNRANRLAWAYEHQYWTLEQWNCVLWTDETWVTPGRHHKTWITRRKDEELDDTYLIDKVRKKKGWMFWGCFYGTTKGLGIFWEKD
jgi:hypothetical protein